MITAMSRPEETERLEDLGRASIQIVHDLKNQLNGLKLYATFLRRRIEKSERPGDEQETVEKLIKGLDRAADDLSAIVKYGQPVELKKQAGVEVDKALRAVCASFDESGAPVTLDEGSDSIKGSFDLFKLSEALKWITAAALKHRRNDDAGGKIAISIERLPKQVVIEWNGLSQLDRDPFRSFAGSDEIKLALAARFIEAHGGSATLKTSKFVVSLPLDG